AGGARLAAMAGARAVLSAGAHEPSWLPGPARCPGLRARLVGTALVDGAWQETALAVLDGARVVAVAGVARPDRFAATLEGCGAHVVDRLTFPDHHDYSAGDVAAIVAAARGGELVTTEKDLVKLAGRPGLERLRALRVALEVDDGDRLVDLLDGTT